MQGTSRQAVSGYVAVKHPAFGRGVCRIFFRQASLSALVGCGRVGSWDEFELAAVGGGVAAPGPFGVWDPAKAAFAETSAARTLAVGIVRRTLFTRWHDDDGFEHTISLSPRKNGSGQPPDDKGGGLGRLATTRQTHATQLVPAGNVHTAHLAGCSGITLRATVRSPVDGGDEVNTFCRGESSAVVQDQPSCTVSPRAFHARTG